VAGVFLRTYEFRDWMVFNPDQARDAMIVEEVLEGKESMLLLGPEVGNNRFGLGPWFYHLEILSAKIFGSEPWKLAIPDLIFSILTIPLFYIFVKKYFNSKVSLLLTFFLSMSYFMVRYSRFAFNPNTIPFFVLLFLLGIMYFSETNKKKSFWGATLIGIGIGVGMQLHILLLFIMPTVLGLFFLYLLFKKKERLVLLGKTVVIIFFIFLTNTGQIAYEIKHGWSNSEKFVESFTESAGDSGGVESLGRDIICQSQANFHILTSLGNSEHCDAYKILKSNNPNVTPLNDRFLILTMLSILFSFGGYAIAFYFWKKEIDERRKTFLALIVIFGLVSLLAMFPIITQASLRYYIVTSFLPFIFLGLWLKYIQQRLKGRVKKVVLILIIVFLLFSQFGKLKTVAENHLKHGASDVDYAIFGEVETMIAYIAKNVDSSEDVYIAGRNEYFSRFYKPFLYFGNKMGIKIQRGDKEKRIKPGAQVIYVQKNFSDKKVKRKIFMGRTVKSFKTFKNVSIVNYGKE